MAQHVYVYSGVGSAQDASKQKGEKNYSDSEKPATITN